MFRRRKREKASPKHHWETHCGCSQSKHPLWGENPVAPQLDLTVQQPGTTTTHGWESGIGNSRREQNGVHKKKMARVRFTGKYGCQQPNRKWNWAVVSFPTIIFLSNQTKKVNHTLFPFPLEIQLGL